MTGLPNLQKLIESATPGDWSADGERLRIQSGPHRFTTMCHTGENAALIAAAPEMAALLIECEQALVEDAIYIAAIKTARHGPTFRPCLCVRCKSDQRELDRIGAALARLADFDGRIA